MVVVVVVVGVVVRFIIELIPWLVGWAASASPTSFSVLSNPSSSLILLCTTQGRTKASRLLSRNKHRNPTCRIGTRGNWRISFCFKPSVAGPFSKYLTRSNGKSYSSGSVQHFLTDNYSQSSGIHHTAQHKPTNATHFSCH